jgi:hypothetical protein
VGHGDCAHALRILLRACHPTVYIDYYGER